MADVARGDAATADAAVAAAVEGFEAWCAFSVEDRAEVLHRLADLIEARAAHLGDVHGILVPGGFGERGSEGKIAAARFARTRGIPSRVVCRAVTNTRSSASSPATSGTGNSSD